VRDRRSDKKDENEPKKLHLDTTLQAGDCFQSIKTAEFYPAEAVHINAIHAPLTSHLATSPLPCSSPEMLEQKLNSGLCENRLGTVDLR
jgi:hypothetical protein